MQASVNWIFALALCVVIHDGGRVAIAGEQSAGEFVDSPTLTMRYLLYEPVLADGRDSGATVGDEKRIPLLLFLHGGGESGNDIERVKRHGPPKLIEAGKEFPFYVLSPQNPGEDQFWDDQSLVRLLDYIVAEHPIDPDRVYLAGLSRGAFGAWRLAIQNPDRFACLVAICGGGDAPYVRKIAHVPTRVVHGAKDDAIPISESQQMVDALRAAGGEVEFTVYPNGTHDVWTRTFADDTLFDWMIGQRRRRVP